VTRTLEPTLQGAAATAPAPGPLPAHVRVAVVGSGFAGIGTAVRLLQEGVEDFVVLERASSLGGTWRDNTYPGCACDVPSHLYSFSFAPNPRWSRAFSPQPEIRAYLEDVAARFGVLPHLHCDTDLLAGTWDDDALLWRLTTSRGDLTADIVVSGCGGLVEPAYPDVPGVGSFAGPAFHSARWDHDVDLTGQRVAVVGTGASAIQFVPAIAPQVAHLTVFQRTPPWIVPRLDRAYTEPEKALWSRVPALLHASRAAKYWFRELQLLAFTDDGRLRSAAQREARRHLARQVPDPELRARLSPDYAMGCKRVLISNDYYPALVQDHVEVVDCGVREVTPRGVVDASGREHEVDVVIYGTGFRVMDIPVARCLTGREGRTLGQEWSDGGVQAHRGTTVAGFPNLFLLLGQHRARAQLRRVHDRGADQLRPGGPARARPARRARARGPPAGAGRLQRGPAGPAGRHGVEHRRLPLLVPRRERPQLHPVANAHLHLPAADPALRRRGLRAPHRRPQHRPLTHPSRKSTAPWCC